MAVGGGVVLHV